jgi:fused signal recognition particle receptor
MESLAREQDLFSAAVSGMDKSLANQAAIAELQGDTLEANRLKAEAAFQQQMRQAQELRDEARKFAQEEGTSVNEGRAGVASRQAAELEEQARQLKELTIQAAERAEEEKRIAEEAAKAKEEADEARKIAEEQNRIAEQRLAKEQQLNDTIAALTKGQQDSLQIAELELQIAQATSDTLKEELQQSLEMVKAEQQLRDASEKVNELFAARIELAKESGAAEEEILGIERERLNSIDRLQQQFEAKQQQREVELAQKRKEEAEALEKEKADAAVKAAEESAKKQQELQKKIQDATKQSFDTTIAGFETTIPFMDGKQNIGLPAAIPSEVTSSSPTLKVQEDQLSKLDDMEKRDTDRNRILDLIRDVLIEIRDSGQSGAFT